MWRKYCDSPSFPPQKPRSSSFSCVSDQSIASSSLILLSICILWGFIFVKIIGVVRVCFSFYLPTNRRISSFLDYPHLPSFACDSKSYNTFGRWFLLYSQSFLNICSHIPQCIKNTMVSVQPQVKWRRGGYELYVNVM